MAIKLLQKREIDIAKGRDRQLEVQEGLKLARRVDGLRETQAQEEKSLELFRQNTVANINTEIEKESVKLEALKADVFALEDRRRNALVPVRDLEAAAEALLEKAVNKANDVDILEDLATKKHTALDKRDADLVVEERRIADMHSRAEELLAKHAILEEDSRKKNDEIEKKLVSTYEAQKALDVYIKQKESEFSKMQEVINSEIAAVKKEKERLIIKEKQLIDREQILQRNIIRHNL